MDTLNELLPQMDFEFFGSGQHGMSVEGLRKNIENDHMFFLDVRSKEEVGHVSFPFAKHIPLNELPQRLDELPKDKLVVAFCSSVFRGAIAYTYLLSQGFEEVKALTANTEDIVKAFKPGPLYKV
ncbi:Rhodanese-like protein [Oleidesulfovibrio alaskensis G20]|jgi:rhodanese-related sulfurtransferase|uniref:Rhodanese-like protein n=1 Tax=Oleidesulfovibrio alaskensis (strain ATCC BAA-1058 / DSM 17464 / G20) TaxID=207559 RepID=Q30XL4_OLEA2|nr:rhodanese-like domain-containing protein [Oleidesulfovibrio alaskensis]ABB39582.1 Rhodanese-like protein [Oleidesulfovibrio alaskensis G20]